MKKVLYKLTEHDSKMLCKFMLGDKWAHDILHKSGTQRQNSIPFQLFTFDLCKYWHFTTLF